MAFLIAVTVKEGVTNSLSTILRDNPKRLILKVENSSPAANANPSINLNFFVLRMGDAVLYPLIGNPCTIWTLSGVPKAFSLWKA